MLPSCDYHHELSRGLVGHDVWAWQLNLNHVRRGQGLPLVTEDGDFGRLTYDATRTYQRRRGLYVDGVVGPQTWRFLAMDLWRPAQDAYSLPDGLIRAGCGFESGYNGGAVNCRTPGGKDCGWMMHRIPDASPEHLYEAAFSGPEAFGEAARVLRERKDDFHKRGVNHENAWRYAILAHNWPAAADHFAAGDVGAWIYTSRFDKTGPGDGGWYTAPNDPPSSRYERRGYKMDTVAQWVILASGGRLSTGYQWAAYYTARWLPYVQSLDVP